MHCFVVGPLACLILVTGNIFARHGTIVGGLPPFVRHLPFIASPLACVVCALFNGMFDVL